MVYIVNRLYIELKKDILFFGSCGVLVVSFFILRSAFQAQGVGSSASWPDDLFSDFISLDVFAFLSFGFIVLASINTAIYLLGKSCTRLEAIIQHIENRFTQLTSSIMSFSIGMAVAALGHAMMTYTAGGLELALLLFVLNTLLFAGYYATLLYATREKPFDNWWGISIGLTLTCACFLYLILKNVN